MKEFVLLAAVCGTVLGAPQATGYGSGFQGRSTVLGAPRATDYSNIRSSSSSSRGSIINNPDVRFYDNSQDFRATYDDPAVGILRANSNIGFRPTYTHPGGASQPANFDSRFRPTYAHPGGASQPANFDFSFRPTYAHPGGASQPANFDFSYGPTYDRIQFSTTIQGYSPTTGVSQPTNTTIEILRSCAPNNCGCRTDRDCHYMLDGYFGAYSKCCDVRDGDEYIIGFHKLCRKRARGQACAKPGLCPDDSREPGHCSKQPDTCALDIDCPLAQKCCPDDCLGQTCKDPQFLRFNP